MFQFFILMDSKGNILWQFLRKCEMKSMSSDGSRSDILRLSNRILSNHLETQLGRWMRRHSLVQLVDGKDKLILMRNFSILMISLLKLFII